MKNEISKIKKTSGGKMPGANQLKGFKKADAGTNIPGTSATNKEDTPLYSVPQRNSMFNPATNENVGSGSMVAPLPNPTGDPQVGRDQMSGMNAVAVHPTMSDSRFNNANAHSDMQFQPMDNTQQDTNDTASKDTKFKFNFNEQWNRAGGVNTNDLFTGALGMIDSLLPNSKKSNNVNPFKEGYNPFPSGNNTQAIFKDGGKVKQNAPIYVDSSNDPRYKAYHDSIDQFNLYERLNYDIHNTGIIKSKDWNVPSMKNDVIVDTHSDTIRNNINGAKYYEKYKVMDGVKGHAFNVAHYDEPVQPIKIGQFIHKLPLSMGSTLPDQINPQQVQVPNLPPVIGDKEWYSNTQNVPYDTEDTSKLYNEDGTKKFKNGGKIIKKMMMGGPIGMSGQLGTMTSNIGSATPRKLKKKAEDGIAQPLSDTDKENWNAFHQNLAYNNQGYATDVLNHNSPNPASLQQWNALHPEKAISRPIADYQNEFTTTPLGRSKVDNYGSLPGQEVGQLTGASSFKQFEYNHYDKNNQLIGHKDPSFNPMSQDQLNTWAGNNVPKPTQQLAPISNPAPVPTPTGLAATGFPTRDEAIQKYKAKQQNPNWHTNESNYNMHGQNSEEMAYGGQIKAADGISVENNQFKMLSPHTAELGGEYHDDQPNGEGGTDVTYGGETVRGQKGEPMAVGIDGSLNLFGKMYVPGTSIKFDTAIKKIAKKEDKNDKIKDSGVNLVKENDPTQKFQALTFNSGKVKLDAYAQNKASYDQQKEALANIQNTMHTMADHLGVEPQKISQELKARYGMSIGKGKAFAKMDYKDIDDTISLMPDFLGTAADGFRFDRNPVQVDPSEDIPYLGYNTLPGATAPRSIPHESMQPLDVSSPQMMPTAISQPQLTPVPKQFMTTNFNTIGGQGVQKTFKQAKNRLGMWDILPEAITMLDQVEPVPGHTINSRLQDPYNVSFQDRRNDNMSTFNTAAKTQVQNPAVIGALAAQQYSANNAVNGEEFRTNQGIWAGVAGDNYKTINEDKKMQLQLDMDQENKQAQAKAYTKRDKFEALKSIANTSNEIKRANFTDSMYRSMYHSQGVDAQGRPLHVDNAYIPNQTVAMADLSGDKDRVRTAILKSYGYDERGHKVSEQTTREKESSKFGKKIKKLTPDYAKL